VYAVMESESIRELKRRLTSCHIEAAISSCIGSNSCISSILPRDMLLRV
jgi:hypothetical protein